MKCITYSILNLLFCIIFSAAGNEVLSSPDNTELKLLRPSDGARIADNIPVFSWQPLDCQRYTIWIDGIKIDSITAANNWYIPFPMSYGRHEWKVVGAKDGLEISSDVFTFTIEDAPLSALPENSSLLRNDWKVISSVHAGLDGSALSRANVNTGGWKSTSVPATVLSVMVRNGLYPNPYTGTNNMKIPDLNDDFNETYGLLNYSHIPNKNPWKSPYWYRREFSIPGEYENKTIWLTLVEINYKAELWLNGKQLADTSEMVGMERQFRFDITSLADFEDNNILAIAIYPPDHPGKPAPPPLTPLADPGTNMADGLISKDYTKWDVLGWDWQPAIRDRDMGITEDVYIHASDDIELDNLYISSDLPLPDTSYADITISVDIINHSREAKKGNIGVSILSGSDAITLEQSFHADPLDTVRFLWDKDNMPQLHIENPGLWWPHGYGRPELYTLVISAETNTGDKASRDIRFGIREVETYIGANERVYKINGHEVYCKGGNWVIDMMLNWTARRYEEEILLTKKANLNLLRIWGPTGVPPEVLYDAADRHGILLWQDFLNDYWGTFRNTPGLRPEISLFEKITSGIVMKYRNHPSLVIWCGGNEGPNPREDLIINKILPEHDGRDSKHYLKISNGDGLHGGGPYHTIKPEEYYTEPKLSGFSSEIGPSGVPVFESVMKFMSYPGGAWMPGRFPLDGVWAYHDANNWPGRDLRKFSSYDNIVRNFYGPPDSTSISGIEDYLNKCQLVNYDVYRACLGSINSQLWENSSGILLWKSNASWPSMTWQLYDWYQQTHAGYFGIKKAAAPICVQLNRNTMKIQAVNATRKKVEQASVSAHMYNKSLAETWNFSKTIDLQQNVVTSLEEMVPVTSDISYLKLILQNQEGETLSDNFYWLSTENDFRSFSSLPEPEIDITLKQVDSEDTQTYSIAISNKGKSLALMTELKLIDPDTDLEILPSFWSDNYFSLLPGEEKTVHVETGMNDLPDNIMLKYKAFNMKNAAYHKPEQ